MRICIWNLELGKGVYYMACIVGVDKGSWVFLGFVRGI
jgi:hypothetical protein